VNYASELANYGDLTQARTSGSRSQRPRTAKKISRLTACAPSTSATSAVACPQGRDRDWEVFEQMFLGSRTRFITLAYAILRNREDAEDAVQDALLSAYVHLRSFEGRSSLTTWFSRIVLNASFMIRRRRRPAQMEVSADSSTSDDSSSWTENIAANDLDPEKQYAVQESVELVDGLLRKMSPTLREAFTLTYFDELSNKQAGALVGVSTGTFKSRLFRARQQLLSQAQRSLAAPIRRVGQGVFFEGKAGFHLLGASQSEFANSQMAL